MDRLGDELLADAGLAEDQHGHRRVGDPLDERGQPLHRGIDRERLGERPGGRDVAAGAEARAEPADQGLDGDPVVGAQHGRSLRDVQPRDRRAPLDPPELGQDREEVVAGVLGEQIHRAQRARDRIHRGVVGDAHEGDRDRAAVPHGAIDLGREPGLAGLGVGDHAAPAQAAGDADDRDDRADRDLVAVSDPAHALDLVAVDARAVAAAEVLDLDRVAAAADPGVHAGDPLVVHADRRAARAPERDVHALGELDDP